MRILGLDLGHSAARAVEVDSAFGRFQIHDYHEALIKPGESAAIAASRLLHSLSKKPEKIVVCVPAIQTAFRNIVVPSKDKKAIRAAVGFELEDDLPFSMDSSVFESAILAQESGSTRLHVNTTLKKYLIELLADLTEHGVDPDIVTTQTWAYRSLMNRVTHNEPSPSLLVHIGAQRTTFYAHHENAPALCQDINWGGQDITERIKSRYRISSEEAEKAKIESGFVLTEAHMAQATPDQQQFSATILDAVSPLFQEIKQATYSARKVTRQKIAKIFVTGPTSQIPGLRSLMEEKLGLPVLTLKSLSAVNPSDVRYSEDSDSRFALATALALCAVGKDRSGIINLRKGEFSKSSGGTQFSISALEGPILSGIAISICAFFSLFVQSQVYNSKISDLNRQLEKSIKTFFGPVATSTMRGYIASPSLLRSSVDKELQKQRGLSQLADQNSHSPVGFLKTLSSKISPKTVVDLVQFQVGAAPDKEFSADSPGKAELTFLFSNPIDIATVTKQMDDLLTEVQVSPTKTVPAPDGSGERLQVKFSGIPKEDAYGQ